MRLQGGSAHARVASRPGAGRSRDSSHALDGARGGVTSSCAHLAFLLAPSPWTACAARGPPSCQAQQPPPA